MAGYFIFCLLLFKSGISYFRHCWQKVILPLDERRVSSSPKVDNQFKGRKDPIAVLMRSLECTLQIKVFVINHLKLAIS